MTREAKIGMLTGLGVIVLIGVLLSSYLDKNPSPRTAALPIGESFRQQLMQPVGVADNHGDAGRGVLPTPAYAVAETAVSTPEMGGSTGPVVGMPVMPQPDGRVMVSAPMGGADNVPTFKVAEAVKPVATVAEKAPLKPAVAGKEYVIAPGDTLQKIAMKFYRSSKPEMTAKIVAANAGVLKDTKTMLRIGMHLVIPDMPASATVAAPAPKTAVGPTFDAAGAKAIVMIKAPGTGDLRMPDGAAVKAEAPKAEVKKETAVYVVKDGDTIEKIARKLSPSNVSEMAKQISTLNKIKDPHSLQIGTKLRVPVKA